MIDLLVSPRVGIHVANTNMMESRAPRVGHKKSRKGCAQCKRRHVKVCLTSSQERAAGGMWRADRIRSVTRRSPVRIAFDTASRVRSRVDHTCRARMQRTGGLPRRRRQQQHCRRQPLKTRPRAAQMLVGRGVEERVHDQAHSRS